MGDTTGIFYFYNTLESSTSAVLEKEFPVFLLSFHFLIHVKDVFIYKNVALGIEFLFFCIVSPQLNKNKHSVCPSFDLYLLGSIFLYFLFFLSF